MIWPITSFKNWKGHCRLMYYSPIAKNHIVTASLSWTGTAALYAVSFFIIFGLIKLIRNSESADGMQVKCLYFPLISQSFKWAKKLTPVYIVQSLHNYIFHQHLSLHFIFFDKMWCLNIKAALATCKYDMCQPIAANILWIMTVQHFTLTVWTAAHKWKL